MLKVANLRVQYGRIVAVRRVSFEIPPNGALAILGTNGAGKTSCVEAVAGLLPKAEGTVTFGARDITGAPANLIVRHGIALVPQLRELFLDFTVEETLLAATAACRDRSAVGREEIYSLFPRLAERRRSLAGNLSGGEQQMLAISRALTTRPALLILDELSAGLSQGILGLVISSLQKIREAGVSLLVVEQNLEIAAALASECLVMSVGEAVWQGPIREAIDSDEIRKAFFR
ncbi:ABC transporter ATP-binding protein [Tardiphaga robiniae]|uniref:ABC transporter ATP-binding protein n=1 Tax=Tardiphaga robiniae TaxID=943830 RepID=A0A7G6U1J2_9BRAD|nr:ABC transporter ATP-binding protein [Tardiphaga robiniae]QND72874.1 ABC transporter ATP-binding protein [Tardiphaga robiniae]